MNVYYINAYVHNMCYAHMHIFMYIHVYAMSAYLSITCCRYIVWMFSICVFVCSNTYIYECPL